MMMFFESELDDQPTKVVRQRGVTTTISETVTVTPNVNTVHSYHSKSADEDWDWEALRDYVVDRIEFFHGTFPRDFRREKSIFSRFLKEFGSDAVRIAKFALEGPGGTGMWMGAPIGVNRFCKGSDDYFARPILEKLG